MHHPEFSTAHRPGRVSVIIPAYNAAATIDETLRSVRGQTYGDLEILVVDDGSTDRTRDIVASHAREDERVRLLTQANAGVAQARNHALAQATGEFVAPVDADDLWKPAKIMSQVELLRRSGPDVGLVYTWFATIDEDGRVLDVFKPTAEGEVLVTLCLGNFVGHASSPLMRTQDVIAVGGYDASLRARGAQGCEDLQLYLSLAERRRFAVVKSVLTGYRQTRAAMSTDARRMLRSYDIVMADFLARHPQYGDPVREGRRGFVEYLLYRSLHGRRYGAAAHMYGQFWQYEPRRAISVVPRLPWKALSPELRRSLKAKLKRLPPPQFPRFLTDIPAWEGQG